MDDLENLNQHEKKSYFDFNTYEEDAAIEISLEKQEYYYHLEKIFNHICQDISIEIAQNISYDERKRTNQIINDFVYGEITFSTFAYLIEYLIKKFGKNIFLEGDFFDFGSGSGRALISAKLLHKFDNYVGIELLTDLYETSLKIKEQFNNSNLKSFSNPLIEKFLYEDFKKDNILFFRENLLEFDYLRFNPSFIFMNCKTFPKELMANISNKIKDFRKGVILITSTQNINEYDQNWEIIDCLKKKMSWGPASLFIHVKK